MAHNARTFAVSNLLTRDTIYTLKLRRVGIDLRNDPATRLMAAVSVRDAMKPLPGSLPADLPIRQAVDRFAAHGLDTLPVTDSRGRSEGSSACDRSRRRCVTIRPTFR